jgi:acetyl esterase/lipase
MRVAWSLIAVSFFVAPARADDPQVVPDVVYGHKDGLAMTYDVIKPAKTSGAALLWIQSGGWYSTYTEPKNLVGASKAFLDKGYTVFIVRHGSAPKYAVPDAVADVRRCVRHVRLKAKEHGIDPERLGVMGMSAGGHLSLMLGTTGDDGDPKSKDEVLKQSSRVAAVVAICPPTDLRGFTTNPPAEVKKHPGLKPPLTFDAKLEPDVSPVLKVTADDAPTLMIHGDKDTLVPVEHSKNMVPLFEKAGVPVRLVVIEGAGHGFTPKQRAEQMAPAAMEWLEKHLKKR